MTQTTSDLEFVLDILRCPVSKTPLKLEGDELVSASGQRYAVQDGIPKLIAEEQQESGEE